MNINRLRRIESLIRTELALLIRAESSDPALQWITVTGVKVSADLSLAKVYVVSHDESDIKQTIQYLNKKTKHFRYQLAKTTKNLRKTPELRFYYDDSISEGNRIDQLLNEITKDQNSI